jgi:hypothetical protein
MYGEPNDPKPLSITDVDKPARDIEAQRRGECAWPEAIAKGDVPQTTADVAIHSFHGGAEQFLEQAVRRRERGERA